MRHGVGNFDDFIRYYGGFVQDDFRVSPKLTLNIGLRWDYNPVQTEEHDRLYSFSPTTIDPATGLPGALHALNRLGIDARRRAETLDVSEFVLIARMIDAEDRS